MKVGSSRLCRSSAYFWNVPEAAVVISPPEGARPPHWHDENSCQTYELLKTTTA
jgi:hypothetical protein